MASSTNQNIQQIVVDFLNKHFTSDKSSLSNVLQLKHDYDSKLTTLQDQLSLASTEIPSGIEKAIRNAEGVTRNIENMSEELESIRHDVSDHTHAVKPMVGELTALVHKSSEVEKHLQYMSISAKVEDLSCQIQASLMTESLGPAVENYLEITGIFRQLEKSSCKNLLHFVKETLLFWNQILQERTAVEFEEVLKAMRWPMVVSSVKTPSVINGEELRSRMGRLFKKLLDLQLPDAIIMENSGIHPLHFKVGDVKPILLPLELMLKPLKKRFRFHFYGNKQTNNMEKPEWYLTQVLSWIRDHRDFLDRYIQPLLDESNWTNICARTEFTRGLIMTVMEKVDHDLPQVLYDENNFSHLIDEILLFESEIRNTYSYPYILPGCLDLLCLPDALTTWLQVEKKFAMQKIEQMFQSPYAWESQYKDITDLDEVRVPECAESFMTLLHTVTDRYRKLPVSDAKLQFLGFQLELLEDFRMRLVQLMKDSSNEPTGYKFCAVLNAVHYVQQVLRDWSELTFFLQLLCYKNNRANKTSLNELTKQNSYDGEKSTDTMEDNLASQMSDLSLDHTVFEEITSLFDSMEKDMIKMTCHYVFTDVQARSQPYRKDRWIALPSPKELTTTIGLSPSACEMFLVLKDHLSTMEGQLAKTLFDDFWQKLVKNIDSFILNEVIFSNHFNDGGALQLQFDMTRNLIPLFGDYTHNPQSYFRLSNEACILLTMKSGSGLLLKEVLYSHLHESQEQQQLKQTPTDIFSALRDVGVFTLTPEQCERVLSLRTNLSVS